MNLEIIGKTIYSKVMNIGDVR